MINKAVTRAFRSADFYLAVEEAVHKFVFEARIFDAVATGMIDAPAFIVPLVKFIKQEIENSHLDKARTENVLKELAEEVEAENTRVEDRSSTKIRTWFVPQAPQRIYRMARK